MKNLTLADIAQRKAELRQKIALQKDKITATSSEIVVPITHITSGKYFINNLKTGMTILNGIIIGYKLMNKFRNFFHKKR